MSRGGASADAAWPDGASPDGTSPDGEVNGRQPVLVVMGVSGSGKSTVAALLAGQRALPAALTADGFEFQFSTLESALADLLH